MSVNVCFLEQNEDFRIRIGIFKLYKMYIIGIVCGYRMLVIDWIFEFRMKCIFGIRIGRQLSKIGILVTSIE